MICLSIIIVKTEDITHISINKGLSFFIPGKDLKINFLYFCSN
jgi:hypothetical protein